MKTNCWTGLAAFSTIAMAGSAVAQESPAILTQDKTVIIEQKIKRTTDEIYRLQGRLKDGQAIASYYVVVTQDVKQFYASVDVYVRDCTDRQRDYEDLLRHKNAFADDLRRAVDSCHAERRDLEADSDSFSRLISKIQSDVDQIAELVQKLGPEIHRNENELDLNQGQKRLIDDLNRLNGGVSKYKLSQR